MFPTPNKHGVYPEEAAERLMFSASKDSRGFQQLIAAKQRVEQLWKEKTNVRL